MQTAARLQRPTARSVPRLRARVYARRKMVPATKSGQDASFSIFGGWHLLPFAQGTFSHSLPTLRTGWVDAKRGHRAAMSTVHAGMAYAFPRVIHGVGDHCDAPHAPQHSHRDQQCVLVAASSPQCDIHGTSDAAQESEGGTAIRHVNSEALFQFGLVPSA